MTDHVREKPPTIPALLNQRSPDTQQYSTSPSAENGRLCRGLQENWGASARYGSSLPRSSRAVCMLRCFSYPLPVATEGTVREHGHSVEGHETP